MPILSVNTVCKTAALALLGAVVAVVPVQLMADETNPDIIHRQSMYKIVSGHMGALRSSLLLDNEKTKDQMLYHAEGIVASFDRMGKTFPAGSDKGITKASPAIWEKPDQFNERGKSAYGAATRLVEVLKDEEPKAAVVSAYRDLGAACKACHDDFRLK